VDDREINLRLLERAETARTNQNSVVWTAASIFVAAQAVLAQAVAQAALGNDMPHGWVALVLALVGLAIAVFGCALVDRGLRFLKFQESVQRIELELRIDRRHALSDTENPLYKDAMGDNSWPAKDTLRYLNLVSVVAWLVASIWFAFHILALPVAISTSICLMISSAAGTGCVTTSAR